MRNILYLSEDWVGTSVHHNLLNSLMGVSSNINQLVLFCLNREGSYNISPTFSDPKYKVCVVQNRSCLWKYKYNFFYKINYKLNILEQTLEEYELSNINLIHASTLLSEGAIAYSLFLKYSIPYVISVRGTDVNFYLKKMIHLWPLAKKIIENASSIVFLSPSLLNKYYDSLFFKLFKPRASSITIVPNGIENVHFTNSKTVNKFCGQERFLYIGRFDRNKNVIHLIKAFKEYLKQAPTSKLTLIGGKGNSHDDVIKLIKGCNNIVFAGEIRDKVLLKKIFSEHSCFVMVSHSETFGLVYIEALLNGLPIIYTKNEGVDGFVPISVGISVESRSKSQLVAAFQSIKKYSVDLNTINIQQFSWKFIAEKYNDIYMTCL